MLLCQLSLQSHLHIIPPQCGIHSKSYGLSIGRCSRACLYLYCAESVLAMHEVLARQFTRNKVGAIGSAVLMRVCFRIISHVGRAAPPACYGSQARNWQLHGCPQLHACMAVRRRVEARCDRRTFCGGGGASAAGTCGIMGSWRVGFWRMGSRTYEALRLRPGTSWLCGKKRAGLVTSTSPCRLN